ncbi:MAG: FAD-dependent oxidoreductase, partial [Planctomycetota bacterium]
MNPSSSSRSVVPKGRDFQAFPELTEDQVDRLRRTAEVESLDSGEMVFERGQREADFIVVLEGCIEIFDFDCSGDAQIIVRHCENQFTGEIDLFSNRKVLVSGRASGATKVLRFGRKLFREMLVANPDIAELVTRALIVRRIGIIEQNLGGSFLLGRRDDPLTNQLRRFLRGNGYPARTIFLDQEPDAAGILDRHGLSEADLPSLLCHGEEILKKPRMVDVAETVGIVEWPAEENAYDLAVIGGGPGGLAAAVYGASEGLSTVVLERESPGGQASTSSRIENYLGFPNGLSGQELAGRAQVQAQKFGATIALPMNVTSVEGDHPPYTIKLDDARDVKARSIVIASGATYRRLDIANDRFFEGRGIHYAATAMEGSLCENDDVIVVGGGNSAGQAAVFLSGLAGHVHLLVRRDSLSATMSDYLIGRIDASSKITLHRRTEIVGLEGESHLESVRWKSNETGEVQSHPIGHVFLMIGAVPNS